MIFAHSVVCQCGLPKTRLAAGDAFLLICGNCDRPQPQEYVEGGRRNTTTADRKYTLHFAAIMRGMQS